MDIDKVEPFLKKDVHVNMNKINKYDRITLYCSFLLLLVIIFGHAHSLCNCVDIIDNNKHGSVSSITTQEYNYIIKNLIFKPNRLIISYESFINHVEQSGYTPIGNVVFKPSGHVEKFCYLSFHLIDS